MAHRIATLILGALLAQAQTKLTTPATMLPAAAGSTTGELRFAETLANGSNYTALRAATSIGSNLTLTLPSAAPASNGECLAGTTAGVLSFAACGGSEWLNATSDGVGEHLSTVYNATFSPQFVIRRARGTEASPSDISAGDQLGGLAWRGYSSSNFRIAAAITSTAASVSGSIVQGDLRFYVYDGFGSANEQLRIDNTRVDVIGDLRAVNLEVTGTCTGCGSGGYNQVREENVNVTQRSVLDFVGAALTAADTGGERTTVTLSQSPSGSTSIVGTGRTISTSSPLSGGGDLSADRTLSCPTCVATGTANTFTANQTISGAQLNFNDATATKIKLYTGYEISIASGALRIARDFNSSKISFGYGNYTEDVWISNGAFNLGNNRLYASAEILVNKSFSPESGNSYDLGNVGSGIGWRDLQLDRNAYIEGSIEQTGSYARLGNLRLTTTDDNSWTIGSTTTTAKIPIYDTSGSFIGWVPVFP